jgi:hypothetical protein
MDATIQETSQTTILEKACASGLTLEQDSARINQLFDQIPKNLDIFSDLNGLDTKITQARVALTQYLHNPALDPELAKSDIKLAAQRFVAVLGLEDLKMRQTKAKELLFIQRIFNGAGILAVGSALAAYLSNL